MPDNSEWLAGLKAGDRVAVFNWRAWGCRHRLAEVESTTKTLVRVANMEFRRKYGDARGDNRSMSIVPVTPEILEETERAHLVYRVGVIKWAAQSTDTLRAVAALIPEAKDTTDAR